MRQIAIAIIAIALATTTAAAANEMSRQNIEERHVSNLEEILRWCEQQDTSGGLACLIQKSFVVTNVITYHCGPFEAAKWGQRMKTENLFAEYMRSGRITQNVVVEPVDKAWECAIKRLQ